MSASGHGYSLTQVKSRPAVVGGSSTPRKPRVPVLKLWTTNLPYSPALKAAGITWDLVTLNRYLLDPQRTVPGNKMPFPGLKTENERKDVIAYLAAIFAAGAPATAQQTPPAPAPPARSSVDYIPDVLYTLRSGIAEGSTEKAPSTTSLSLTRTPNRRGLPAVATGPSLPFALRVPATLYIFAACLAISSPVCRGSS
jgi:hypothetical protein